MAHSDADLALALSLQQEELLRCSTDPEQSTHSIGVQRPTDIPPCNSRDVDLCDPGHELNDPTPDIHQLFVEFDGAFFWRRLRPVMVSWSSRMTRCAGVCSYQPSTGLCSIRLSRPLLTLRPRSDLVQTLLHEMIHAFLFVTGNSDNRQEHGPEFHRHMHRINQAANTRITVYHSFHAEVQHQLVHWWRCDGVCRRRPPYFGFVRRAINRAPAPRDFWWRHHAATCGGTFEKIRQPPGYGEKKARSSDKKANVKSSQQPNIADYFRRGAIDKSSSPSGSQPPPLAVTAGKRLGGEEKIPWYKRAAISTASAESSSCERSRIDVASDAAVKCPVCGEESIRLHDINVHMDVCLMQNDCNQLEDDAEAVLAMRQCEMALVNESSQLDEDFPDEGLLLLNVKIDSSTSRSSVPIRPSEDEIVISDDEENLFQDVQPVLDDVGKSSSSSSLMRQFLCESDDDDVILASIEIQ